MIAKYTVAALALLASLAGASGAWAAGAKTVKDHKEDIAKYQKESHGSGPAADYAKQILPKLREHLKIAEDLERGEHVASASQNSKAKTR